MLELQELDPAVSIRDQLNDEGNEPVVLINVFHVSPEKADALIAAWADDARYFKGQPGFISTQLHRGIAGSGTYLNYAVWESVGAFKAAFGNPIFHAKLQHYPEGATGSPHLFRKMAVEGLCVA
jgi:heme-degrading monooxygenase HmoA